MNLHRRISNGSGGKRAVESDGEALKRANPGEKPASSFFEEGPSN
jgi:hypothetical protein